jgi:hypothetical protein
MDANALVKYGLSGIVLGAALALLIAVKQGYVLTPADAEHLADQKIVATEAGFCVSQFNSDPHYQDNLKQFSALDFTKREDYIQKGGWDKMPGQKRADDGVSRICGDKLAANLDKPAS